MYSKFLLTLKAINQIAVIMINPKLNKKNEKIPHSTKNPTQSERKNPHMKLWYCRGQTVYIHGICRGFTKIMVALT